MTEPIIKVPGMFLADAYNVPLAKTSDIFDDNNELYQDQINRDLYNSLSNKADSESIPTVNDGTFSVKTKVDNETVVAADFTANQSIADDITFIQGDNITLTTDTNNRTITISASSSPAPVDAYTKSQTDDLLNNKVDKVNGKGLSTNDYTDLEKNKLTILPDASEIKNAKDVLPFDSVVPSEISTIASVTQNEPDEIIYSSFNKKFVAVVSSEGLQMHYYEWPGYEKYVDESNNNAPYNSKVYLCGGKTYVWDGTDLVPGDGKQIQSDWNQANPQAKDFIKNKPTIPTVPTDVSAFNNDAHYVDEQALSNATEGKANKSEMNIIEGAPDSPAEGKAIIKLKQGVSATVLTKHQDISGKANTTDVYPKTETYSKTEINNMITTPDQEYVTVTATAQTTDVTDLLPNIGSADTIYRVGSWDGTQYDDTCYSEYSWNGTTYIKLSTKDVGVDDEPTAGSNNLVKSGGAWKIPKFLFVENCPWIKEMYITQEGLDVGIGNIHNIYSDYLSFSNTEGTAFVGITVTAENSGINCIYYFNGSSTDNTRILGYIIVDWANIPSVRTDVNKINDIAKNLIYSPSIKAFYFSEQVSTVKELGYDEKKIVSQKVITENLDAIFTDLIGHKQEAVATTYPPLSVSNTSYIWFIIPNQRLSKINRIKFLAKEGTINFYKVKYDGINAPTKEDITSVVVNSLQDSSVITIDVDVNLASDEYIGINGAFWFGTVDGNTTRSWELSTGIVSDEATQYLFVNAYYEDVNAEIEDIKKSINDDLNKVVMYSSELNSENSDIVGTQQIVDGALRVGSSLLYLNKFYSLGIRTFRAICKFNADTLANFVTVYFDTHTTGTWTNNIIINISQRAIACGSGEVVYCPLLVNYNHEFIIDITKHFQHNVVKITDLYSGAEWEYVWTFNGPGGVGGGAIGTRLDTGMAWDLYGFYASSGTFDIKKITVLGKKADVVFYGDSITEPEAYWPHNIFYKSWTQLLYTKSRGRILSSGRSGTNISSLMDRMQAELPYLKPKAVFITIGTNGGVSYSSLETIINYIKSLDIVPYINHIPANINSGGRSNHAEVNAIVDQIRTQMNVKGIDFDKPTSVDYTGGNVNTAMMWWEEYASPDGNVYHHPNELGSAAMVARVDVDTPEIYSI